MKSAIQCLVLALVGAAVAWIGASRVHEFVATKNKLDAKVMVVNQAVIPQEPGDLFAPLRELSVSLEDASKEKLHELFHNIVSIEYTTWHRSYALNLIINRWLAVDPAAAIDAVSKDATLLVAFADGMWLDAVRDHETAMATVSEHVPLYHQVRLIEKLITLSSDAQKVAAVIDSIEDSSIRLRVATAFVHKFNGIARDEKGVGEAVDAWAKKNPFLAVAAGYPKHS